MRNLVTALSAITLLGASAHTINAATIKEEGGSLSFKTTLQLRAYGLNDAQDVNGNAWDPLRSTPGEAEFFRFDARRVRLGIKGAYGEWQGDVVLRGDKTDRTGDAVNGRPIQLYYAKIKRTFKLDNDLKTSIRLGLDKSFNNDSSYSSSNFVLPGDSVVGERDEERAYGIGWMLHGSFFNFGLDLHNNSTGIIDGDAHDGTGPDAQNGYFYNARFEFAPTSDLMISKKMQSFAGAAGTGVMIGINAQLDAGVISNGTPANSYNQSDVLTWGPDLLIHVDGFTGGAEFRSRHTESETGVAGGGVTDNPDVDGIFWDAWVAYAFPVSDIFVEPVIRYSVIDNNSDIDATTPYNTGSVGGGLDNGGDGSQIDLGINLYFNGHATKLMINYQFWKAETGNADAHIFRIQQQLEF